MTRDVELTGGSVSSEPIAGPGRRSHMRRSIALLTLPLLLLTACGSGSGGSDDPKPDRTESGFPLKRTRIRVRFNDASVPPEHHRSSTTTIDADETEIVVDSYGDVVGRDRVPTDPDQWSTFLADLDADLAALPDAVDDVDGCTGGTSTEFEVTVDGEVRFSSIDHRCGQRGGEQSAVLGALLEGFLAPLDPEA